MPKLKVRKPAEPNAYRIAMDWWVIIPLSILLIALIAIIPMLTVLDISLIARIFAGGVVAFTFLYIVDSAFFTYYLLTDAALVVVSQLRHFEFPYRAMREVRPIGLRGLFSFRSRKRFATSARGFQITLHGERWKNITVSPLERDTFIRELMEHVEADRSERATATKAN